LDSNVDWIGRVPKHWAKKKLKFISNVLMGQSPKSDECNDNGMGIPFLQGNAEFGHFFPKEKYYCETPNKVCKKNSLLLSVRAPVGALNKANKEYGIGRGLCAILAYVDIDVNYLWFSLHLLRTELEMYSTGSTFDAVSVDEVKNIVSFIPPIEEQNSIAEFLDYKTSQIDELIKKKGELLRLLAEKRIALITQAVTKGLNPNVKMKPSGIDWLGDIPEHWEVKRLKFVAKIQFGGVDKKTEKEETEVLLCNYVDVYKNEFIDKNIDFMRATASEREIIKFTVEEGDVLVTKDSETPYDIAVPGLVIENLPNVLCGYHLAQIKSNKKILLPPYLFRLFQSKNFNVHFTISANGITRFGVGTDVFGNAIVPVFSKYEQQNIVDYIQINCDRINSLEKSIIKAIEKLKEYRTSLITSAVTGKIRVPTGNVKDYKTSKERKV
jgi:type I restriction enzyme S subunit